MISPSLMPALKKIQKAVSDLTHECIEQSTEPVSSVPYCATVRARLYRNAHGGNVDS